MAAEPAVRACLGAAAQPERRGDDAWTTSQRLALWQCKPPPRSTRPGQAPHLAHTIRHTTAMHLLQSGVDISVISRYG